MERYIPMHTIHDECENDKYSIQHKVFKHSFRSQMDGEFMGQNDGDIIAVLVDKTKDEIVMSDSVMEKKTNLDFLNNAKGNILVAGLGLGMILIALKDKKTVEKITVVEIDQNLIDLISPTLSKHINIDIINQDINDFDPKEKYDTIYCDIWNNIEGDNLEEMTILYNKLKGSLSEDGWISNWRMADTIKLSDCDTKHNPINMISEDEAIQVIVDTAIETGDTPQNLIDLYEESKHSYTNLVKELDSSIFVCEHCGWTMDINEQDSDGICSSCSDDYMEE